MVGKKEEETGKLLEKFASSASLSDQLEALKGLINLRAVHACRDDGRFKLGFNKIAKVAEESNDPEEKLLSLAILGRIGTVKSLSNSIKEMLQRVFESSIPPFDLQKDPDDRYYVAVTLHAGDADWVVPYVAKSLVNEKQAEKARQELVDVHMQRVSSLAEAFQLISSYLKEYRPDTKKPGDSAARRLERIISALRPMVVSRLIEPGEKLGDSIQGLFRSAFVGVNRPETLEVAEKTAESSVALVHDIIRTQISMVAETSVYASLDVVRNWFPKGGWALYAQRSVAVQRLVMDLCAAMILLGKQGITDVELFDQLVKIIGSREKATQLTAEISSRHPELKKEVREWLRKGGKTRTTRKLGSLDESEQLSADPLLATLMSNASRLDETISIITDDMLEELRIVEPSIFEYIEQLMKRSKGVNQGISSVAKKRGLRFRGQVGDVVEYSPVAHEIVGEAQQGIRKVRVIRPLIERVSLGGSEEVILKALVKAV